MRYSVLLILLTTAFLPAWGQDAPAATKASIRLVLPADSSGRVALEPGTNRIILEVPVGAQFPMDFTSASNGLIRGSSIRKLDAHQVRVELELAAGVLDRVEYQPNAIVLIFKSRFAVPTSAVASDRYLIGADDRLRLTVHGRPELSSSLTVNRAGMITAPVIGDLMAAGLSTQQLANRIAEQLDQSYLVDPQVDVWVEEFNSQWVMVDGEVRDPGRIALRGGTQLKEILSEAGGLTDDSGEQITISRRAAIADEGVTIEIARVDFESGRSNPVLESGDIVTVNRVSYAYVHGEVSNPTRVRIERGMTLLKALTLVGGLTEWANRKEVKVLYGEGTKPTIYNLKAIQRGKVADPPLHGDEIIVVERRFL